jgi:hypothetical protein
MWVLFRFTPCLLNYTVRCHSNHWCPIKLVKKIRIHVCLLIQLIEFSWPHYQWGRVKEDTIILWWKFQALFTTSNLQKICVLMYSNKCSHNWKNLIYTKYIAHHDTYDFLAKSMALWFIENTVCILSTIIRRAKYLLTVHVCVCWFKWRNTYRRRRVLCLAQAFIFAYAQPLRQRIYNWIFIMHVLYVLYTVPRVSAD